MPLAMMLPPNLGINELALVDIGIFFKTFSFSSKKEPLLLNYWFFLRA